MFGTIIKGGPPDLNKAIQTLRYATGDGRMLRVDQPDDALGVPVPKARDLAFRSVYYEREDRMMVEALYTTPGPKFRERRAIDRLDMLMFSERKNIEHRLQHEALKAVQAAVEAHNAVVQPIYNGPEDRVYLSETGHRVSEAVKAAATPGATPDATELEAACRANLYAADIVIANFNRKTS